MCIFKNITPLDFKNKFLTLRLENFVSIGNVPMYNKEYNKVYSRKYLGNLKCTKFLNLPIEDLKTMVIKQLKDKIPVYMGAHIINYRDKKSGILDIRLYDYRDTLDFNPLSKNDIRHIIDILITHVQDKLKDKNITLTVTDSMKDYIAESGFDQDFGARPLKRAIQRIIEDKLALLILQDEVKEKGEVVFDIRNNELSVQVQ